MKALIYDIEIKKAILGKNEQPVQGIEYCDGWDDHENMGISVICAYDTVEGRYRVFTDDNKEAFFDLTAYRSPLVGFNSIKFDNAVIRACWGNRFSDGDCYDILREIWVGYGLSPEFQYPSHLGYGLDDCCKANFGEEKSGNGALAPVRWQQGNIGGVVDYCLQDVRLTRMLFQRIVRDGWIRSPKNQNSIIKVRRPE